jgi:predicted kinase
MSKLIIMQGLPASGKTTKAREILKSDGNAIRVNKDELRLMLHGDRKWNGKQEKITNKVQSAMIVSGLGQNKTVIVDDTNLNPNRVESLKQLAKGHKVEVLKVDTPFDECICRDRCREKSVGRDVIERMAIKSGLYPYSRHFILCDLDGTIADLSHRLQYITGDVKDYDKFYDNAEVLKDGFYSGIFDEFVQDYANAWDAEIVFFSGRSDVCREGTLQWLYKWTGMKEPLLFMRREGDYRPDHIVKKEMYNSIFNEGDVLRVYDDRPSVIRMWREMGLEVVDCGNGEEF